LNGIASKRRIRSETLAWLYLSINGDVFVHRITNLIFDSVPCSISAAATRAVKIRAGKLSLQPEVLGAGQEATNGRGLRYTYSGRGGGHKPFA
jgi:hypothetical protein